MKISTKKGDNGETDLLGGKRVSKDHIHIQMLGDLDELNSSIGVASSFIRNKNILKIVSPIQNDIFEVGAFIAGLKNNKSSFNERLLTTIEKHIQELEKELPELENFILPNGSTGASFLFQSRTICRRTERSLVHLINDSKTKKADSVLKYLNRLSDLLFLCARKENIENGIEETIWTR